jgi:hypothetical protein
MLSYSDSLHNGEFVVTSTLLFIKRKNSQFISKLHSVPLLGINLNVFKNTKEQYRLQNATVFTS